MGVVGENAFIDELSANDSAGFDKIINTFNGFKGRFKNAEQLFVPQSILGYSIGVKQMFGEGYILCGNSTEFLDPVFLSGVTLDTASGLQAAKLVDKHLSGVSVNWQAEYEDLIREGVEVFRSHVNAWYNGDLQTIFFASKIQDEFKQQICSVLAGYVWDKSNSFIKKHKTILSTLAKVITMNEENKSTIQR